MISSHTSFANKIARLLRTNTVMTMPQLCLALDGRSRGSVYRDLKKVPLITSYSHSGQYYVLKSMAKFDLHGLWFFNDIGFSSHGTLKATLETLITRADLGMTQKELKTLLRIPVQNTLSDLVKLQLVSRTLIAGKRWLYINKDKTKGKTQFKKRVALQPPKPPASLPAEHIQIDILLAVIRCTVRAVDDVMLTEQLKNQGLAHSEHEIMAVLRYYELKKNRP
jgi:hypothetical protein